MFSDSSDIARDEMKIREGFSTPFRLLGVCQLGHHRPWSASGSAEMSGVSFLLISFERVIGSPVDTQTSIKDFPIKVFYIVKGFAP